MPMLLEMCAAQHNPYEKIRKLHLWFHIRAIFTNALFQRSPVKCDSYQWLQMSSHLLLNTTLYLIFCFAYTGHTHTDGKRKKKKRLKCYSRMFYLSDGLYVWLLFSSIYAARITFRFAPVLCESVSANDQSVTFEHITFSNM